MVDATPDDDDDDGDDDNDAGGSSNPDVVGGENANVDDTDAGEFDADIDEEEELDAVVVQSSIRVLAVRLSEARIDSAAAISRDRMACHIERTITSESTRWVWLLVGLVVARLCT